MALMKCKCGGIFRKLPDLDGMYCDKCDEYTDITLVDGSDADMEKIYDAERIKAIRGVPTTELTIGSETKGRCKVVIPTYCTKEEAESLINMQLDYLSYLKDEIDKRHLDIYSSRGKKESE